MKQLKESGASMSLTGSYAKPGSYQKEGYDICAEEVNAKGGLLGRKVEFVLYDDQSMPATAVKHPATDIGERRLRSQSNRPRSGMVTWASEPFHAHPRHEATVLPLVAIENPSAERRNLHRGVSSQGGAAWIAGAVSSPMRNGANAVRGTAAIKFPEPATADGGGPEMVSR